MKRFWQAVRIIAGLIAIRRGMWKVRRRLRLRRAGIRLPGVVVWHKIRRSENATTDAPVVSFTDGHGSRREITSKVFRCWLTRKRRVDSPVRIVSLRGRPETTRLDAVRERMWGFILALCLGVLFVVLAVVFALEPK